ncbi:MAG: hypothetical protein M1305_01155 [Candidatus Marsarchaeota archaeon]|jgi:hypothetical protein|nr:hypothetical protein [Candidatus Marsarchaeota archaeon]MCL5419835.1 hypothetical protein [Candidatus Marsarchaeota archaeon]
MGNLLDAYLKEASKPQFGSSRLVLSTGKRQHASIAMVEDRSRELAENQAISQVCTESCRYVLARNITYDFIVSVYDISSTAAVIARPSMLLNAAAIARLLAHQPAGISRSVEIRIIGMQNGATELAATATEIQKRARGLLAEVDLFGNETRNIAIDLKTGTSYDLLLNSRIYGPAELINKQSRAEFDATRSELAFV